MNINGIEIEFDMDNRKDNARFVKAFTILQKKQESGQINDEDMEAFLAGCIKSEQVKQLLEDGRISTLTKVFVEFFKNTVDQFGATTEVYADTAKAMSDIKNRASQITTEYQAINSNIGVE